MDSNFQKSWINDSMNGSLGTILLLLLLFSVCVVPVMAGKETLVVEDGVHLVQLDNSATVLDPSYYVKPLGADFVVDGNQYYWIRIGNVVAKGLTTVWWATWVILISLIIFWIVITVYWERFVKHIFPKFYAELSKPIDQKSKWVHFKTNFLYVVPLALAIGFFFIFSTSGVLPDALSHTVCGDYMDIQASDGTILLKVDKIHPETNTLYIKSGVNLTTLTHLSNSGVILNPTGVKPA